MITWKIEKRNIDDLQGYDKNPRKFTDKGLKDLKKSLQNCGDANIITINSDNTVERDLYEQMYQNYLDSGVFESGKFNVMYIVDNDVVNYCDVITKEDYPQDFEKLLELYHQGERDVSCESFEDISPSYIEAVSDDEERILIRY